MAGVGKRVLSAGYKQGGRPLAPGCSPGFAAVPSGRHPQRSRGLAWLQGVRRGRREEVLAWLGNGSVAAVVCAPGADIWEPDSSSPSSDRTSQKRAGKAAHLHLPHPDCDPWSRRPHACRPGSGRGEGGAPLARRGVVRGAPEAAGLSGVAGGPGGAAAPGCHPGTGWWPQPGSAWPAAAAAWPCCRAGLRLSPARCPRLTGW